MTSNIVKSHLFVISRNFSLNTENDTRRYMYWLESFLKMMLEPVKLEKNEENLEGTSKRLSKNLGGSAPYASS